MTTKTGNPCVFPVVYVASRQHEIQSMATCVIAVAERITNKGRTMMSETVPLCPECNKPLRRNTADEHIYPWYCVTCDVVYDWPDLEYAATTEQRAKEL